MIVRQPEVEIQTRLSRGTSADAIYKMVARALSERGIRGEVFVDVGCGTGQLWRYVDGRCARYVGLDVIHYENTPPEIEFHRVDLQTEPGTTSRCNRNRRRCRRDY